MGAALPLPWPPHGRLCSAFRFRRAWWAFYKLASTTTRTGLSGLSQLRLSHFCKSKSEKSTGRGLIAGAGYGDVPTGSAWVGFCDLCPRNSSEEGFPDFPSSVTEAQNIIDFTFVGINAQREALMYTRSYTSLVAKSSSLVPNNYFFCYTSPCFLSLVYNLLTYQDEMIKY